MSLAKIEELRSYLQSPPMADCGQGFHQWLMAAGNKVARYFEYNDAYELLMASARIAGRANPKEVNDTLRKAYAERGASYIGNGQFQRTDGSTFKREPAWPEPNHGAIASVVKDGPCLYDLWEQSPTRFDDDEPHGEEIIDALFPGNPFLCVGMAADDARIFHREGIRGCESDYSFIVPSTFLWPHCRNMPGHLGCRVKENVDKRRFLVTEFDFRKEKDGKPTQYAPLIELWESQGITPKDAMASIIWYLRQLAKLALVVDSGGKSLHAWWYCEGSDEQAFETREGSLAKFFALACGLGADRAGATIVQFMRMPGGMRNNGNRQTVLFFNPEYSK
jgi:hypothetical protein